MYKHHMNEQWIVLLSCLLSQQPLRLKIGLVLACVPFVILALVLYVCFLLSFLLVTVLSTASHSWSFEHIRQLCKLIFIVMKTFHSHRLIQAFFSVCVILTAWFHWNKIFYLVNILHKHISWSDIYVRCLVTDHTPNHVIIFSATFTAPPPPTHTHTFFLGGWGWGER